MRSFTHNLAGKIANGQSKQQSFCLHTCRSVIITDFLSCCRSLTLRYIPSSFLPHSGPNPEALQSLSYQPGYTVEIGVSELLAIARFSGVTKLSLSCVKISSGFQLLCHPTLQELALQDCPNGAQALFTPGALTALRKLSIEEPRCDLVSFGYALIPDFGLAWPEPDSEAEPESAAEEMFRQLTEAGRVLLSMPSLSIVSGSCMLFMAYNLGEQEGWSRQIGGCSYHGTHKKVCMECHCTHQEWRKNI